MRIFHRSKILRLSGWIYDDAISARYQYRVGPRENPRGKISDRISQVGEEQVCTSIVVAAELCYGAARKNSPQLTAQLESSVECYRNSSSRGASARSIPGVRLVKKAYPASIAFELKAKRY
jgi:hypothetical protein